MIDFGCLGGVDDIEANVKGKEWRAPSMSFLTVSSRRANGLADVTERLRLGSSWFATVLLIAQLGHGR